jgi:hypothetical protein
VFKSKNDFIFTGRKTITESDSEFQFDKYLYADDRTIDSSQSEREFRNLAALQFPENRGATIIIEF